MTQTLAILADAYRRLCAQKMFWIVLMISCLVVASFAAVGINPRGMTIFGFELASETFNSNTIKPVVFYKGLIFADFGIHIWLSLLAIILALISTAGIFPDLIAEGAIDMILSKPISRLRVFLTVYAAGLMFVALQVIVFCLAAFFVLGVRGGFWEPAVFLAVPLVVCLFSYLFSVCTLLGLATRSTVAALLLTMLFWLCLFGIHSTDIGILTFRNEYEQRGAILRGQIETLDASTQRSAPGNRTAKRLATLREERDGLLKDIQKLASIHKVVYAVKTALPKTYETVLLLERVLVRAADLPGAELSTQRRSPAHGMLLVLHQRPLWWVLGTSLAFEIVILAAGAAIFQRRDF